MVDFYYYWEIVVDKIETGDYYKPHVLHVSHITLTFARKKPLKFLCYIKIGDKDVSIKNICM